MIDKYIRRIITHTESFAENPLKIDQMPLKE